MLQALPFHPLLVNQSSKLSLPPIFISIFYWLKSVHPASAYAMFQWPHLQRKMTLFLVVSSNANRSSAKNGASWLLPSTIGISDDLIFCRSCGRNHCTMSSWVQGQRDLWMTPFHNSPTHPSAPAFSPYPLPRCLLRFLYIYMYTFHLALTTIASSQFSAPCQLWVSALTDAYGHKKFLCQRLRVALIYRYIIHEKLRITLYESMILKYIIICFCKTLGFSFHS